MANPIKKEDIFDEGSLESLKKELESIVETSQRIVSTIKEELKPVLSSLQVNMFKNTDDIKKFNKDFQTSTKLLKTGQKVNEDLAKSQEKLNKLKIQEQKLAQEKAKTVAQEIKAEQTLNKAIREEEKEREKLSKQKQKEFDQNKRNNSEYGKAVKRLAELKTQLKELEITGRTNGKLYKALGAEFVTLNGKVRDAEEGVGEFQRNVGNYPKQIKAIIAELSKLEPGTEEFIRLSKEAGELKDRMNDAREAVTSFATGSKFQQFGTVFGQVKDDLLALDFAGAAEKARTLATITRSITFKEALGGLKDLGAALFNLGKSLLTNPLFLLVGVLGGIAAALFALKDRAGIVGDAFNFFGSIVKRVTGLLKGFTDAIGLTNFALEENSRKAADAAKKNTELISKQYEAQIAKARAAGKETADLESKKEKALQDSISGQIAALQALASTYRKGSDQQKEILLELAEAQNAYDESILQSEILQIEAEQRRIERLKKEKILRDQNQKELSEQYIKSLEDELAISEQRLQELNEIYNQQFAKILENENAFSGKRIKQLKSIEQQINKEISDLQNQRINSLRETYEAQNEDLKKQFEDDLLTESEYLKQSTDLYNKYLQDREAAQLEAAKSGEALAEESLKKDKEIATKRTQIIAEQTSQVLDFIAQAEQKGAERRAKVLDDQIKEREKNISRQQALAERGLENQLAFEQAQLAQEELRRDEQKKREAKRQELIAFLRLLSGYAEKQPERALQLALRDIALAKGAEVLFAATGAESISGPGTETSDSIPAMLSVGESVITAAGTKEAPGLATAWNQGRLDEYIFEKYLPKYLMESPASGSSASNMAGSAMLHQIVQMNKEIKDLKNMVANRPVKSSSIDNIGNVLNEDWKNGVKTTVKLIRRKPKI